MEFYGVMAFMKSKLPICEHIKSFEPYVAGLSIDEIKEKYQLAHVIKMASNENPFGSSKLAKESMVQNVGNAFRYPQAGNPRLVKAIANYYQKNILLSVKNKFLQAMVPMKSLTCFSAR